MISVGLARLERNARRDIITLTEARRMGGRRASAVANDHRLRRLQRQLRNPPGPRDDAIWSYMRSASNAMRNVFDEAAYQE